MVVEFYNQLGEERDCNGVFHGVSYAWHELHEAEEKYTRACVEFCTRMIDDKSDFDADMKLLEAVESAKARYDYWNRRYAEMKEAREMTIKPSFFFCGEFGTCPAKKKCVSGVGLFQRSPTLEAGCYLYWNTKVPR